MLKEDHIVKAMVFPEVMYRGELDVKKAGKKSESVGHSVMSDSL